MKGCLTFIIKTIIAVLVFFGLLHLGVIDFLREKYHEYQDKPSQESMLEKTQDVIDLSDINDEYTIDKSVKFLGNRVIIANHGATEQKMIMLEPKKGDILKKEDIKSDKIEEKIKNLSEKYKHKLIKFDDVEVGKTSKMKGLGQTIPYVKITATASNLPMHDIQGILGVAELEQGKNIIVVSVNEKGKYSQIITDAFYNKVKQCDNTKN